MSRFAFVPACFVALSMFAACAVTSTATQEPVSPAATPKTPSPYSMQVDLGVRDHHGDSWAGLDDQTALDVTFVYTPETWPIALEGGVAFAQDRGKIGGDRRNTRTTEISIGVRKEFPLDERIAAVVGAGVFTARTEDFDDVHFFDSDTIDSDGWHGVYAHGGVFVRINEELRLGFDLRLADGTNPEIDGARRNGDYTQYAVAAIFGF